MDEIKCLLIRFQTKRIDLMKIERVGAVGDVNFSG